MTGLADTEVTQYAGKRRSQQPPAASRGGARLRHFAKGRNGLIRFELGNLFCHLDSGAVLMLMQMQVQVQVQVQGYGFRGPRSERTGRH